MQHRYLKIASTILVLAGLFFTANIINQKNSLSQIIKIYNESKSNYISIYYQESPNQPKTTAECKINKPNIDFQTDFNPSSSRTYSFKISNPTQAVWEFEDSFLGCNHNLYWIGDTHIVLEGASGAISSFDIELQESQTEFGIEESQTSDNSKNTTYTISDFQIKQTCQSNQCQSATINRLNTKLFEIESPTPIQAELDLERLILRGIFTFTSGNTRYYFDTNSARIKSQPISKKSFHLHNYACELSKACYINLNLPNSYQKYPDSNITFNTSRSFYAESFNNGINTFDLIVFNSTEYESIIQEYKQSQNPNTTIIHSLLPISSFLGDLIVGDNDVMAFIPLDQKTLAFRTSNMSITDLQNILRDLVVNTHLLQTKIKDDSTISQTQISNLKIRELDLNQDGSQEHILAYTSLDQVSDGIFKRQSHFIIKDNKYNKLFHKVISHWASDEYSPFINFEITDLNRDSKSEILLHTRGSLDQDYQLLTMNNGVVDTINISQEIASLPVDISCPFSQKASLEAPSYHLLEVINNKLHHQVTIPYLCENPMQASYIHISYNFENNSLSPDQVELIHPNLESPWSVSNAAMKMRLLEEGSQSEWQTSENQLLHKAKPVSLGSTDDLYQYLDINPQYYELQIYQTVRQSHQELIYFYMIDTKRGGGQIASKYLVFNAENNSFEIKTLETSLSYRIRSSKMSQLISIDRNDPFDPFDNSKDYLDSLIIYNLQSESFIKKLPLGKKQSFFSYDLDSEYQTIFWSQSPNQIYLKPFSKF